MPGWTIALSDVGRESLDTVGGKGANLGELHRLGVGTPAGFCLTTAAFRHFLNTVPEFEKLYVRLEQLDVDDRAAVEAVAADVAAQLADVPVPEDVRAELVASWRAAGAEHAYAVRSSATAEDLAGASFAGQHDTLLNVRGEEQLLDAVKACWLSLFSDRAIGYRARHGFDHRTVDLAVVVQRMVLPTVSGVMFTADPVSGSRGTVVVNASYGLGEAVVSGLVNPDLYRLDRAGRLEKTVADKELTIEPVAAGGITRQEVDGSRRTAQALTDGQILELARLGRRLEEHFGEPQDVEWAWDGDGVHLLQSRPVTTLYPLPPADPDGRLHVFFSLGHQQMMTEAMKPLSLSLIRTYFPFGTRGPDGETRIQVVAGNRLFIDYTDLMHTALGRFCFAHPVGTMDARMGAAFLEVARRPEFQARHRFQPRRAWTVNSNVARTLGKVVADLGWTNLRTAEPKRRAFIDREAAATRAAVGDDGSGDRIGRVQRDMAKTIHVYYELTATQFSAAVARHLLDLLCRRWLGDTDDLAALDKSLPGNVTTEMSLAIGDLADLLRERPEVRQILEDPPASYDPRMFDGVPGGAEFGVAFESFLDSYGMRCPGELDITRERWRERPQQLFAGLLANTRSGSAGEHRQRFDAGVREADEAQRRLLRRLGRTPLGLARRVVVARLVDVYRTMMGMREHQKFLTVYLYDAYRRAIRAEGARLVDRGVLATVDDVDFLSLHELRGLVAGDVPASLAGTLADRRAEYEFAQGLTAPRLMTSEGEVLVGLRAAPLSSEGVLTGLPVSAGVVEGVAHVVRRPEDAKLDGDAILVAPFTDPAWTPLFSAVKGMVVEVGGLMTHGAVVARELGLPAVVGVDGATRLIPDGARIRVDGSLGIVELLKD